MPRLLLNSYIVLLILSVAFLFYSIFIKNKHERKIKAYKNFTNKSLPILVMACNSPTVKQCLESLIKWRPKKHIFPIIVSQDCDHEETYQIIKSFTDQDPTITVVRQPDLSDIPRYEVWEELKIHYRIARHYKFALNYVFRKLQHQAVIVVEDDLKIAPDFYEYFQGTYPLLYEDPTIWCVSAWNDNCKKGLIEMAEPELLHRTDFFPGLGWMLRSKTWDELEPKWPEAFFEDWLRDPLITRGRVCIRPEISRTYRFGTNEVSNMSNPVNRQLGDRLLNKEYIPFTRYDLAYIRKKMEHVFFLFVYLVPEVSIKNFINKHFNKSEKFVRVTYRNIAEFRMLATNFGLMDDLVHGIPRTALQGVVQFFYKGQRVFFAPKELRSVVPSSTRTHLYL